MTAARDRELGVDDAHAPPTIPPPTAPGRLAMLALAVLAALCIGLFARDFWTPDEPREADLAWRMSVQSAKSVPELAGAPFCEKPPLTYWVAGGILSLTGLHPWAARLPNLLYALLGLLALAELARRAVGRDAALPAAALLGTFLLTYQVSIWLATDAPLLAFDALALLGVWIGYHAPDARRRLGGYALMHLALALGFLSKSAAAWIVPGLTLLTLIVWDRRPRELLRIALWAPLVIEAALIVPWVLAVYRGPDGLEHLKVFFWNNLVGRFTHVAAPAALEYTSGHRNVPGKYLLELPMYLWPWTLLVAAALRRAWQRRAADPTAPAVRFALASTLPALLVLSLAATARNIYLAPALPGFALLLASWWQSLSTPAETADARLVRASAALLGAAVLVIAAVAAIVGADARFAGTLGSGYLSGAALGVLAAGALLLISWRASGTDPRRAVLGLLLAWCVLLVAPAGPVYGQIDRWQDLERIARAARATTGAGRLVLLAPDETTLAFMDLYARAPRAVGDSTLVPFDVIAAPLDGRALEQLVVRLQDDPSARALVQEPGRRLTPPLAALEHRLKRTLPASATPSWALDPRLDVIARYELPNGRRYALLRRAGAARPPLTPTAGGSP